MRRLDGLPPRFVYWIAMNYRAVASTVLALSLLPALGCDKATPVAPDGSVILISANPTKIGLNGQSTITVIGRKPDGQPLNTGSEIRLTTDRGTIDPPIVAVDATGRATATFRADGRQGVAKITAMVGSGTTMVTTEIQVGEVARSIVLQPTPTTIPETGGTVTLLAIIRDASGLPLANQGVNFTTDVGRLNSRGGIVQTNASGQARDTLVITEADLSGNVSAVNVSAQTVGTDGALLTDSVQIRVQGGRPAASFAFDAGSTTNEVFFTDTSTGGVGQLLYSWDFGDNTSSNDQNPTHTYAAGGWYTVRLTVTDGTGQSDTATARITVPVTAPGTGQ